METRLVVGMATTEPAPFSSGATVFPAGSAAPLPSHKCAEQVTVLEGQAEVRVGAEMVKLGPMESSFVPADMLHSFRNCGLGRLVILWINGARDVTRTFTGTGETVPHVSSRDQV